MTTDHDQHRFIEKVLAKTGWSQTDLAHRAGLDPSTLSRFLTKGRDGHALRSSTIQRIASASGISLGESEPQVAGLAEAEASPYISGPREARNAAIKALQQGYENLDAWELNSRALENAGYKQGDVLLVGLGETPLTGDVVCAQIYDWNTGKAQTVFRLYQPPALVAATTDASLLKPYLVSDNAVAIKGVVLHCLRSRNNH